MYLKAQGYFVRLSARSPKDSGFGCERMHSLLQDELSSIGADLLLGIIISIYWCFVLFYFLVLTTY